VILYAIFIVIVFAGIGHGELYKYKDSQGVVRYTDNFGSIPEQYRDTAERQSEVKRQPVQKKGEKAASGQQNDSENKEQTGKADDRAENNRQITEERKSLVEQRKALEKEYEQIEEERERLSADRPADSASKAQKTEYEQKVKELNDRIDAYQQNVKAYEEKVDAFNSKVDQMEAESESE
ncbi:MAG: DUF4124 domain-containing protein, partial [Desulfosalsimonas sp.]